LSDVFRHLKRSDEANAAFQKSLQLHEQLVVEFADVREYRLDLALCLNQFGIRLASDGAQEDARKSFDRAHGLLDRLVQDFPGVPIYHESLATQRFAEARLLRSAGQMEPAEAAFRDAVTGFERLTDVYPGLPRYREQLAAYARQFAKFLHDQNRPAEAESMYRLALSHWQRLASDFPEELDYARLFARNLVLAPVPQWRDPERAVAAAQRAVQLAPTSPDCWSTLGLSQFRLGKPALAVATLQKAVVLRGKASGFDSFCLSLAYAKSGDGMLARQWYDQGEEWIKKHSSRSADLIRLRTEAAELLQIEMSHTDPSASPKPSFTVEEPEP
jgi:tetratricopeptide (TPR) repeat protein